jgi:hypothetical protein
MPLRISGTPSTRTPVHGEAAALIKALNICSVVTNPSRRAPSRVEGIRSISQYAGISAEGQT